jgi:sulfur-carrier protein adenylyltransferase/sulfurtransferase
MTLNDLQRARYSRQMVLPGFGEAAQERLLRGSVLVVGAGGLGAPSLLYLTAAGVGRIGIIDDDVVDRTNLHRQVLFTESDVGRPKVDAAARRLGELNHDIRLEPIHDRLTSANALDIIRDYDIVVDGTDQFQTRYLVNDACVLTARPNVYGSVFRFEGQVAVFGTERGPCYRCLFPDPPPPGTVPDCAEGGVIGAVPGFVGSLQALEAIKLLTGLGEPASGSLLLFDGLTMATRHVRIRRDPDCPICGHNPTIRHLIDYDAFCGRPSGNVETISATQLAAALSESHPPEILDVRSPEERARASIGGLFIPLAELEDRLDEVPLGETVVVCRSGRRSETAARLLQNAGRHSIRNLSGGLDAWRRDVDPTLPPA